jgi:hypothetical protein
MLEKLLAMWRKIEDDRRKLIKGGKLNPLLHQRSKLCDRFVAKEEELRHLASETSEKEKQVGNYVSVNRLLTTAGDTHFKYGDLETKANDQGELYMRLVEIYAFRVGKLDSSAVGRIVEVAQKHAHGKTSLYIRIPDYYRKLKEEITHYIASAVLDIVRPRLGGKGWVEGTTAKDRRVMFLHMIEQYPIAVFENLLGRCADSIDFRGIIWNKHPETAKWRTCIIEKALDLFEYPAAAGSNQL